MKNLIMIILSLFVLTGYAQINPDGSLVSINSNTVTASEGTVKEGTRFTIYLADESLSAAVFNICAKIKARVNTDIYIRGTKYTVQYSNGIYRFIDAEFDNKSELIKYLNPWLKEKILSNLP